MLTLRDIKKLSHVIITITMIMSTTTTLKAEEVGKFAWKDDLSPFDGGVMEVPLKTVAMDEYVYASTFVENIVEKDPTSIVFIIDHSQSNKDTDPAGQRYKVISELLQLIYDEAPETRVGLVIFGTRTWFWGEDDPDLFTTFRTGNHGAADAYIPPLELDKDYSGRFRSDNTNIGEFNYTKTGIEVLKMYLKTQTNDPQQLEYIPTHEITWPDNITNPDHKGALTNISLAFRAAKHAHLNQELPLKKNKHFNIFFSDGGAGIGTAYPDYAIQDEYKSGTDVPTTFTFYYEAQPNALADLQLMTNNIKTNGYSTVNNLSKIWNMAGNITGIKDILVDEVFGDILSKTTSEPTKIEINTSTNTDWDSTGFKYQDMFVLQKGLTPFQFDLDVHIVKDSLDDKGNVLWTEEKDTSVSYSFDVQVGPSDTIPKHMKLTYWGRTLAWGDPGNVLTDISSDIISIPLNFESYKVDTTFPYDSVPVEIRTIDNSDRETITLSKSGNTWTGTIDRVVGGPTIGDGTLQHKEVDELIAVFRNPFVPLDTMEVHLFYTDSMTWELGEAAFFDNSANGRIDSLFVEIIGERWESNLDAIADAIVMPAGRQLDKVGHAVAGNGIGFTLNQNSPTINTAILNSDLIEIVNDLDLPNKSVVLKTTVLPKDQMAPVALSAIFTDSIAQSAKDYIAVTFSEDVTATDNESIHLFKTNTIPSYDVSLQDPNQSGSVITYLVNSIAGVSNIMDGDSLKINTSLQVYIGDSQGILQQNSNNVWAPISVEIIEEGIKVSRAAFFDDDANGYPDRVRIWTEGELAGSHVSDIANNITFPTNRNFTVDNSIEVSPGIIDITVLSGSSSNINTATDSNDELSIGQKVTFPDGVVLLDMTCTPEDSMAPVAVSALFRDSITAGSTDFLTVNFSEIIGNGYSDINALLYKSSSNIDFSANLENGIKTNNQVIWELSSITGHDRIRNGDTLWINSNASTIINDNIDNKQSNELNRRCPINVEIATGQISVIEAAWFDGNADGRVDTVRVKFDRELESDWVTDIENTITFNGNRNLTLNGTSKLVNDVLYIPVLETTTNPINTAVNNNEGITINNPILLSEDWALAVGTINAIDKMAPVAISAHFLDSIATGSNDYLTTVFSEDIESGYTALDALKFKMSNNTEYQCVIQDPTKTGSQVVWKVLAVSGTDRIKNGDSLWINSEITTPIGDGLSNAQNNGLNLRCPITVEIATGKVLASEAVWLDGDADGRVDTIKVSFNIDINTNWISDIENEVVFEGPRNLTLNGTSRLDGKTLYLPVSEDLSNDIKTDLFDNEAISWNENIILSDEWALSIVKLEAVDGMAPVVISALCTDTVRHYIKGKVSSDKIIAVQDLEVIFSEDILNVNETMPLTFITNGSEHNIQLNPSSINGNMANWKTASEADPILVGDSVKINTQISGAIEDIIENIQTNQDNRTVLVDFFHYRDTVIEIVPYTLIPKIIHLHNTKKLSSSVFDAINGLEDAMNENNESKSEMKLSLIGLVPDEMQNVSPLDKFSAKMAIFDAVGNKVYGPAKMVVKEGDEGPEGLYRIWNGQNESKRLVGSGGYVIVFDITIDRYGGVIENYQQKSAVGVFNK